MRSSPRFTGWEVKPTIRTRVLLNALLVERSNLPSGHAFFSTLYGLRSNLPSGHVFFSTLYGLRGQTYHQDMRSSPRFTGWEVKPTMRTRVPLHALRAEVKPTIRTRIPLHALRIEVKPTIRTRIPLHALRVGVKPTIRTRIPLHASRVEVKPTHSSPRFTGWSQTYHQNMCSSPRFTDWGQTYHQNMFSSPRFTGWEVKPTIRTCIPLHALRVERSNLPSGHAFFSTLYGWRGQTYHEDKRSSPRFTGWEVKPTIRSCVLLHALRVEVKPTITTRIPLHALRVQVKPTMRTSVLLHALRVERSNLPSGHVFFSTPYGLRGQTYHQDMCSPPRFTGWEVKPTIRTCIPFHALRVEVKPTIRTRVPLHALRVEVKPTVRSRTPLHAFRIEVKPTIGTCISLHALRVERSNLPSGHAFFSTLYGLRAQTYHQDMRSSARFTGGEVKPTMRTSVLLHALRVERSNLPSGLAFFSTLYGLRGQTYHQDIDSSQRFTGREVKPTIRTCVLLHALRVERSNLPWGQTFFSTLHGLRGQTYHQVLRSSPRFTDWEVKPTMRTSVPLHIYGLRSNLPSEHVFFSTLYGLRGRT